jgi:hypothetical protein
MKKSALVLALLCFAGVAMTQTPAPTPAPATPPAAAPGAAAAPAGSTPADAAAATCEANIAQNSKKPLHGAALASAAGKCCRDQAKTASLHGAAATSFVKKCTSDVTTASKT